MARVTSGVPVAEECKLKFLELQRKKAFRFIVFKLDEEAKLISVDKLGDPDATYQDLTSSLPPNECRYAVYDFEFTAQDGIISSRKSKIFFIAWSPDAARVRAKMIYASSKDMLKQELNGLHYEVQATDLTELDLEVIKERAK